MVYVDGGKLLQRLPVFVVERVIGLAGEGWERAVVMSWVAAIARSLNDAIGITSNVGN